jgi:16S rRNA processing protein RimM
MIVLRRKGALENIFLSMKSEYFVHDIIGCVVQTTDGKVIGVLEDVVQSRAQDLWAIRINQKIVYIPAVKEFIKSVNIADKTIVVSIIEGLIEEQQQ